MKKKVLMALKVIPLVAVMIMILIALLSQNAVLYRVDVSEGSAFIIDKYGVLSSPIFQEADDAYERLVAVRKSNQWGFFDIETKVERYFGYTKTYSYSDGLALVQQYPNTFFIDSENKPVTGNLNYDHIGYFSEGLCPVARRENGVFKYGFIDKTGRLVIPIQYDSVKRFKDDVSYVMKGKEWLRINSRGVVQHRYPYHASLHVSDDGVILSFIFYMNNSAIYVDRDGRTLDLPRMYAAGNANNNRITMRDSISLKYGYKDYIGEWGIFPLYDSVSNFTNNRAFVVYDSNVYLIDSNNMILADLGAGVSSNSAFYTDYATIRKPYSHVYMNEKGDVVMHEKMILAPKTIVTSAPVTFFDGTFGVVTANGKFKKYPEHTGKAAVALRTDNYTLFSSSEGVLVSRNALPVGEFEPACSIFPHAGIRVYFSSGKYTVKDAYGKILEDNLDTLIANPFIASPAIIGLKTSQAYYINANNSTLLKEGNAFMPVSENGYVGAQKNGYWGALDPKGKWAIIPNYSGVTYFNEGFAAVQSKDTQLWHYITTSGKELFKKMPVNASFATPFYNGVALIRTENGMHYLSKSGAFWRPKDDFNILYPHTYKLGSYLSGHGPTYTDKNGSPISVKD